MDEHRFRHDLYDAPGFLNLTSGVGAGVLMVEERPDDASHAPPLLSPLPPLSVSPGPLGVLALPGSSPSSSATALGALSSTSSPVLSSGAVKESVVKRRRYRRELAAYFRDLAVLCGLVDEAEEESDDDEEDDADEEVGGDDYSGRVNRSRSRKRSAASRPRGRTQPKKRKYTQAQVLVTAVETLNRLRGELNNLEAESPVATSSSETAASSPADTARAIQARLQDVHALQQSAFELLAREQDTQPFPAQDEDGDVTMAITLPEAHPSSSANAALIHPYVGARSVMDLSGKLIAVTEASAALVGARPEDFLGRPCLSFTYDEDLVRSAQTLAELFTTRAPTELPVRIIHDSRVIAITIHLQLEDAIIVCHSKVDSEHALGTDPVRYGPWMPPQLLSPIPLFDMQSGRQMPANMEVLE